MIEKFLEVTNDYKGLDDKGKLKVLREILAKVANVKFQDVVTQVGRKKTGRGGKEITRADLTTRGMIDAIAGKKDAIKRDREKRAKEAK